MPELYSAIRLQDPFSRDRGDHVKLLVQTLFRREDLAKLVQKLDIPGWGSGRYRTTGADPNEDAALRDLVSHFSRSEEEKNALLEELKRCLLKTAALTSELEFP